MPEAELMRVLVSLGIPGVALGVFYLLLRRFGFKFEQISKAWAAIIAIIFLLIVGGVTFYALRLWGPTPHSKTTEDVYRAGHGRIIEALVSSNYVRAEGLARDFLRQHPNSIDAKYNLAVALNFQAASATEPSKSKLLDEARALLLLALENGLLKTLRGNEGVVDPVKFVTEDSDLSLVFAAHPGLRIAVQNHSRELQPFLGTTNYNQRGSSGGGCFTSPMRVVMADGSLRPISKVQVGDMVRSRSPNGSPVAAVVTKTGTVRSRTIILNGVVEASLSQPMLTRSEKLIAVRDLRDNDELLRDDGTGWKLQSLAASTGETEVFWLEVEPFHIYVVEHLWAHNKMVLDN